MEAKERRQRMADLTMDMNDIDHTVERLNDLLGQMVADDISSDTGQLMIMFNPHENVYIKSAAPLVLAQPPTPPGDTPPDVEMMGMNLMLSDSVLHKDTTSDAITLTHRMMIRLLSTLTKDMMKEQGKLETKLNRLVATKKL